jgi:hypothetical protein
MAMNAITHLEEPLIAQFANPELLGLIGMSDRSIAVIGDRLLYGMTFEQIAEKHGVTRERARQIYSKAIASVARKLKWHVWNWAKMPDIEKENAQLKSKIRFFEEQELKGGLVNMPPSIDDPIEDLLISVRLYGSLKANKINTIRDVLSKRKNDFLVLRNIGKVTLIELEGVLKSMGITDWK